MNKHTTREMAKWRPESYRSERSADLHNYPCRNRSQDIVDQAERVGAVVGFVGFLLLLTAILYW